MALLSKLAEDLAYGLQALRIEAEHQLVREVLGASEEQFRQSQKMEPIGQLARGNSPRLQQSLDRNTRLQLEGRSLP